MFIFKPVLNLPVVECTGKTSMKLICNSRSVVFTMDFVVSELVTANSKCPIQNSTTNFLNYSEFKKQGKLVLSNGQIKNQMLLPREIMSFQIFLPRRMLLREVYGFNYFYLVFELLSVWVKFW